MIYLLAILLLALVLWYILERSHRKTKAMAEGVHKDISLPHEETWELYHNSFSLCSKKARICLAELEIPYKSHHIDLIETGAYENISRRYLSVNPAALVPLLVHEGHPVFESHAQIVYAAERWGTPDLLIPKDADKRALMQEWVGKTSLFGEGLEIDPNASMGNAIPGLTVPIFATMMKNIPTYKIFEGLLFHRFKIRAVLFLLLKLNGPQNLSRIKPAAGAIKRSTKAMRRYMDELEEVLSRTGGPWIVGEQFTLADVGLMAIFDRLSEGRWLETFVSPQHQQVALYWRNLQARDSFRQAVDGFRHPYVNEASSSIERLRKSDTRFGALYGV